MPPVPTVSQRILDLSIRQKLGLASYEGSVVRKVIALLNAADPDLEARLSRTLERTAALDTGERLAALRKEILAASLEAYQRMGYFLTSEMRSLVESEAEHLAELIESSVPFKFSATRPDASLLKALVTEDPLHGRLLGAHIDNLAGNRAAALMEQLQIGTVQGESWGQILTRIRGTAAGGYQDGVLNTIGRRQAETLARTAVLHFTEAARDATIQENADLFQGVMWISTLDKRTTKVCQLRDGEVWDLDYKPVGHSLDWGAGPGRIHWQCLPGETVVKSGIPLAATKRWFEGQLAVIETTSGLVLRATPNHPVLTNRGWIGAGSLVSGDYVVRDAGVEWARLANEDANQPPTAIHKVASSAIGAGEMMSGEVPLSAVDFHGDAADGDVADIATNRHLLAHFETARTQHSGQFILRRGPSPAAPRRQSLSKLLAMFFGLGATPGRNMGRSCKPEPSFWTQSAGAGELLLGTIAQLSMLGDHRRADFTPQAETSRKAGNTDPFIVKAQGLSGSFGASPHAATRSNSAIQDGSGDSGLARRIISGEAGSVELDRVVDVSRVRFAGHVFNLTTTSGAYTAGGIITHNCRSTSIPVLKNVSDLRRVVDLDHIDPAERAALDHPAPVTTDFEEWLRTQDDGLQEGVLGVKRAEEFRSGASLSAVWDMRFDRMPAASG